MEILSIEVGRAIQLVVPDEVRAIKGTSLTEAVKLLVERYNFGVFPSIEEAEKDGLKFRDGRIVSGNKMINIKELGVYNDGVIADTYHTSDSDFVINDVISWAQKILGLREPKTHIRRMYASNIIAELDARAIRGVKAITKIADASATAIRTVYGLDAPIEFAGASWSSDMVLSTNTLLSTEFNFARRINRPYSENRFFFVAPISTDTHIEWIRSLEETFIDG